MNEFRNNKITGVVGGIEFAPDYKSSRRKFIKSAGIGAGSLLLASQLDCGGQSVSGTVTLITGGVSELKLLFPSNPLLDKIVKLATDFNADWVAGKFDSARTFFENLDSTVQQVIGDLGVTASPRVKLLLASLGIAVRIIASLIGEQATPAAVRAASDAAPQAVSRIKELSNAADAERILSAVKH